MIGITRQCDRLPACSQKVAKRGCLVYLDPDRRLFQVARGRRRREGKEGVFASELLRMLLSEGVEDDGMV